MKSNILFIIYIIISIELIFQLSLILLALYYDLHC